MSDMSEPHLIEDQKIFFRVRPEAFCKEVSLHDDWDCICIDGRIIGREFVEETGYGVSVPGAVFEVLPAKPKGVQYTVKSLRDEIVFNESLLDAVEQFQLTGAMRPLDLSTVTFLKAKQSMDVLFYSNFFLQ